MKTDNIYQLIHQNCKQGKKMLSVLIDPDKYDLPSLLKIIKISNVANIDFFFVGGSLMVGGEINQTIKVIKDNSDKKVVIFPGSPLQMNPMADGILFLSLISGRNPELLIGQHVIATPYLQKTNLEVLSTGYLLIDCGSSTTAQYISNTMSIPYEKGEIAAVTALAGEYLGLKLIYLDGGSGAKKPINIEMISAVKKTISLPLIVGGGIRSANEALNAYQAGADMIVIGNILEKDPNLLFDIADKRYHEYS